MTRDQAGQRMTELANATAPIVRRLQAGGDVDSAALLKEIDRLSDAYQAALSAGMRVVYEAAAWDAGREARPYGVGENGR